MDGPETPPDRRHVRAIAAVLAGLLAVRFFASTALVDVNLSPPTLLTVGAALEAYEVLLAFVLVALVFVVLGWRQPPVALRTSLALLGVLGAALVVWLLAVLGFLVPVTIGVFLVLGVAALATASWLAYSLPAARRAAMRPWARTAHAALLAAIPVLFALRVAALEGLDPVTGSGGLLRGNWFFVHLPTIAIEFLVLAIFLNVLFDRSRAELRRRWYAFLPFLAVPLILDAVTDRPLTGYVLSALVSWGANLALFSPALYSWGCSPRWSPRSRPPCSSWAAAGTRRRGISSCWARPPRSSRASIRPWRASRASPSPFCSCPPPSPPGSRHPRRCALRRTADPPFAHR